MKMLLESLRPSCPVKIKQIISKRVLLLFVIFLTLNLNLDAAPYPELSAQGAILMDARTGRILYSKNQSSTFFPASTTKVLTSLILLEDLPKDLLIQKSIDSIYNVPSDSSHIGLRVGDHYSCFDGLHGIMMSSDNYISYDMARIHSGTIKAFSQVMNTRAKSLGALNSHFVNPHGYHDPDHYTTPYDLGLITRAAFSNPELVSIAGTSSFDFYINNRKSILPIEHTAALLKPDSSYYNPYVIAAKTGYHTPAGRTLVAKADYGHIQLIGVIMKTDAPNHFKDMNALLDFGAQNFESLEVTQNHPIVYNISFSPEHKIAIDYALKKKWIFPHLVPYNEVISKRTFLHLVHRAFPNVDFSEALEPNTSLHTPTLLNEPITQDVARGYLKQVWDHYTLWGNPLWAYYESTLQGNDFLTLEETLHILYDMDGYLNRFYN